MAASFATKIPKGHVDPGVGEAGGGFAKLPAALVPELGPNSRALPGAPADDERRHRLQSLRHRFDIGPAAALPPADQAVVRKRLDQNVGDAITLNLRAYLAMHVGHAHGNEIEPGDLHDVETSLHGCFVSLTAAAAGQAAGEAWATGETQNHRTAPST